MHECFFASLPDAGSCDGRLVRCHLIPRQQIKRALATRRAEYRRLGERLGPHLVYPKSMEAVALADPRCWVWGCGGPMGNAGHHGQFQPDGPKPIPLSRLPVGFLRFMSELGLWWWVERTYNGRRPFTDYDTVTVDGAVGAEEWNGAHRLPSHEMPRRLPYRGE